MVRDGEVVVIVPTRRAANGSKVLALPKGHVDPGDALHAAGRILAACAGAALVILAVLVPLGALLGLAWGGRSVVRRRRRHAALQSV